MAKKYQDKYYVLKELSITENQLERAVRVVKKRHPLETNWIIVRRASNGQSTIYYCTEFIDWLKEVYFFNEGYYLDLEIKFYKKLIDSLNPKFEEELQYKDMSVQGLMSYFNKDYQNIRVAIHRMNKNYKSNLKYYMNDDLIIKAEGVKWINEKYYRKSYLKYLENQKQLLDGNAL